MWTLMMTDFVSFLYSKNKDIWMLPFCDGLIILTFIIFLQEENEISLTIRSLQMIVFITNISYLTSTILCVCSDLF